MSQPPDPKSSQDFLTAFGKLYQAQMQGRAQRDIQMIKGMFSGLAGLYRLRKFHEKQIASKFNLFRILRIEHLEEKTHTPFLAELLSPSGSHGQGDFFYQAFIQDIFPEKDHPWLSRSTHLKVAAESHTFGLGRIDLLITNPEPGHQFAIVIENKIYASDQPQQLQRYLDFALQVLQLPMERIRLVYLSPHGQAPGANSLNTKKREKLTTDNVYVQLSYRKHITTWLKKCLPDVKAPIVQETILQYLKTIQKL